MKKWLLLAAVFFAFSVSYGETPAEEVIPKISQRRDNYIDKASVFHEENVNYRVDNNETVRILLDVKNNDIEKLQITAFILPIIRLRSPIIITTPFI